jgi:WbqC-like protein family
MRVVISQPMYFPWVGLLEQFKLADIFVYYDDVQFVKGSLFNRVQVKTPTGIKWLTVPLRDKMLSNKIIETRIDDQQDWRAKQLALLGQSYAKTPFLDDMLNLARNILDTQNDNLADLAIRSMNGLADYFDLSKGKQILRSSELGIDGNSSQRVFDICRSLGATEYITGHGAANYLDYELFGAANIAVSYMHYEKQPYLQLHGEFTPYVSALDLVANCGKAGRENIFSNILPWNDYVGRLQPKITHI